MRAGNAPVAIFGVGGGPTNPEVPSSSVYTGPAAGCASMVTAPSVQLGNTAVQVDFTVPAGFPSGDATLTGTFGGTQSQANVAFPVQYDRPPACKPSCVARGALIYWSGHFRDILLSMSSRQYARKNCI
jgi:hypothetical protein